MRRGMKALAFLCIFALMLSSVQALAEFSPKYEELKQRPGMTITLSGKCDALTGLSASSLKQVNAWLNKMRWIVTGQSGGGATAARLNYGGEDVISVSSYAEGDDTVTVFAPSGSAYQTAAGQPDAIQLLAGRPVHLYDPLELPGFYQAVAKALYPALDEKIKAKTYKTATSVRNAAASASYQDYVFKADELNAAWPEILSAVLPAMREALKDQTGVYGEIEKILKDVAFASECRFKRMLDKEGGDMGLQFTGSVTVGKETRKVTLFGGYTKDRGGYVSFSAPQVKGKNNIKFTMDGKVTATQKGVHTLSIETNYTCTLNGTTATSAMSAKLKNTVAGGQETWSGKITYNKTENKVKTVWTLTPEMAFTDEGLNGKIAVQRKTAGKADLKATVNVTVTEAADTSVEPEENAKDLRDMTEEKARAAVQAEWIPMVGVVAELMDQLPDAERDLLTHELRTEEWLNGATVPAPEEAPQTEPDDGEWPEVEEEETPEEEPGEDAPVLPEEEEPPEELPEELPEEEEQPEEEAEKEPVRKPTVTPPAQKNNEPEDEPEEDEDGDEEIVIVYDDGWYGEDW